MAYSQVKRSGIMLCYPFEEKRLEKWGYPVYVQPKLDGERCRAVYSREDNKGWQLWSSQVNEFISVPHIIQALYDQKIPITVELDGELYRHGLPFEEIHSRVSRTVNLHSQYSEIRYCIFDVVDPLSQMLRITRMSLLSFQAPLYTIKTDIADSLDDIMRLYDKYTEDGYEGIIVRHPGALYVRKRSTYIMKFKPKKDDYYHIKGYSVEIDIYGVIKDGILGRIICAGTDISLPNLGEYPSHKKLPDGYFGIGSGFTDDQRYRLWSVRSNLMNNLCHVQYQHITSGKGVPRFPIFMEIVEVEEEGSIPFAPTFKN